MSNSCHNPCSYVFGPNKHNFGDIELKKKHRDMGCEHFKIKLITLTSNIPRADDHVFRLELIVSMLCHHKQVLFDPNLLLSWFIYNIKACIQ